MGSKISIDKHVSQLEDILQLNPKNLEHVNLESKIPDSITQNIKKRLENFHLTAKLLKEDDHQFLNTQLFQSFELNYLLMIWKFYEDPQTKTVLNQAIKLQTLQNQNNNTFVSFPHSMWGIVESYQNLTPRGLENPLSTSGQNLDTPDSFLLPSQKNEKISLNFEHMIFVWNGKNSNPLVKSLALSSAYNLESLIEKGKDNILEILFNGRVIDKNKLKNGKLIQLNSTSNKPHNKNLEKEINKMSQTIFLFKFLFPLSSYNGTTTCNTNGDGDGCSQEIINQKNQNWINQDEQDNIEQNCNIKGNGITNNNNQNFNQGEVINPAYNEYSGNEGVNQQQFYSSASVDSNSAAAQETQNLKFFKKQFCESNVPSYNFLNNFIRIPAKKNSSGQIAKKFQDAKLEYENIPDQQFAPTTQKVVPPLKMKFLNQVNKQTPMINDNNEYVMNDQGNNGVFDDYDQNQNNYNQTNEFQNYAYDQDNQNLQNEGLMSDLPGVRLNIHYGNGEEDMQEKFQNMNMNMNINLNQMNDIQNKNMNLESPEEELQNHKNDQDNNTPISSDNQEDLDNVYDYPIQQQYQQYNNYHQDFDQPLPSHRGGYGLNQTSNSNIAEASQKKLSLKLGNINQSNKGIFTQPIEKVSNITKEEIEQNELDNELGNIMKEEINGGDIQTQKKIKLFSKMCSAVIENFLYVSGEEVAYNLTMLKSNGITHIINCAGDVCKNKFPGQFVYKTYRLKDGKNENIECVFYDTIEFIEQVARQKGRVFIHCVQGISRSITLSLAYIIWKQKKSFKDALIYVKQNRDIASPNVGFIVQLINFERRLFEDYDKIQVKPRVWCVCSHQVEQPQFIVAKMLLERLYIKNKLDPRGVFIIQTQDKFIIWIGKNIPQERSQIYQDYAKNYIETLRIYERVPQSLVIIQQNEESEEFWQMWDMSRPQYPYQENIEWNNWFLDLTQSLENEEDEDDDYDYDAGYGDKGEQSKPKLFIYPEESPLRVFDDDELCSENLLILCREQGDQVKIFIWKGSKFMGSNQDQQQFLNRIKQNYFPNRNYLEQNELVGYETDEFMDSFLN